jgi:hypothetical protein
MPAGAGGKESRKDGRGAFFMSILRSARARGTGPVTG